MSSDALIVREKPQRSLNRQVVVDEDEYTEALSKIIARDFFPSLAHLEATNTFLSSLDSQDQREIEASARRLVDLQSTPRSAWGRETPFAAGPSDTPSRTPSRAGQPSKPQIDTSISLDAFQARYTSEDNASFTEILDDENRKRKEKWGWAWEAEKRASERKLKEIGARSQLLLQNPMSQEGASQRQIAGTQTLAIEAANEPEDDTETDDSEQESSEQALVKVPDEGEQGGDPALEVIDVMAKRKDTRSAWVPGWRFKNRNSLMFAPDADESPYHQTSAKQITASAREAPKVINSSGTRMSSTDGEGSETPGSSVPPSPTRSRIEAAISGTPYRTGAETPKVGGFGFVDALPSPTPSQLGPDALKELMTWGTLMGTPKIIRDDDGDVGGEDRPTPSNPFNISKPSQRDEIGRRLGSQASRSLREKAALLSSSSSSRRSGSSHKRKSDMPPPAFTPRRGAGAQDMLSPAARNLLGMTSQNKRSGLSSSTPRVVPGSQTPKAPSNPPARQLDLRKVGWSPSSTPQYRSASKGK